MKPEFDPGTDEEALPEPRLVKRIILKRDLIVCNRLDDYRSELPYGLLLNEKKKMLCNAIISLYEMLRPKLEDPKKKNINAKFKDLKDLDDFRFDSFKLTNKDLKDLINYKSLLEDFIEFLGITKIEIEKGKGDILRR